MFIRFLLILTIFVPVCALGAMSSTNYSITADTVDTGGYTTSTNYGIFGALGEWQGFTSSTNYSLNGGFSGIWGDNSITFSMNSSSVSLGTLSTAAVGSVTNYASSTTNYAGGYALYVSEISGLASGSNVIDDVVDGSVTAGNEEYGIRTSGTSGLYNSSDTAITTDWKKIAEKTSAVTADSVGVIFNVAISPSTPSGTYSQTVSFAAVAQF